MTSQTVPNRTESPRRRSWVNQVIIRQAKEGDLPALEWDGEYAHFRKIYADAYQRAATGSAVLWVAELPGAGIIGQVFIQLICDRPEMADGFSRAYLYSFRIQAAYRRAGLGTRILRVVEADLVRRGFEYVTLNVAKTNLDAQRLYVRMNYRTVAHEAGVWNYPDQNGEWHRVEEPAWRMEKRLAE